MLSNFTWVADLWNTTQGKTFSADDLKEHHTKIKKPPKKNVHPKKRMDVFGIY